MNGLTLGLSVTVELDDEQDGDDAPAREPAPRRPRRRRMRPRSRTIDIKRLKREARGATRPRSTHDADRPQTREDCRDAPRPCPWVACKHHLYLDINPETGSIKINFPDLEPWELAHTCALDVAERGGITLEEVGEITNLTRERVRQVEVRGLIRLKFIAQSRGIQAEDAVFPHAEGFRHPDEPPSRQLQISLAVTARRARKRSEGPL